MQDDPPPSVEYLDEWDSTQPPQPHRDGRARLLVLSAAVIVIAIALGGTQGALRAL